MELAHSLDHATTASTSAEESFDGSTLSVREYKTSGTIVLPVLAGGSDLHDPSSPRLSQQLGDTDICELPGGTIPQAVKTSL